MNPKVADMASKVGFDAADYTWFDFSELGDHADEELKSIGRQYGWHNQMMHLDQFLTPSDHMAVIQPAWLDIAFTYDKYIKFGGYEGAAVMLWANDGFESPLAIVTEKRVHVVGDEGDGTNIVIHQKLMDASKRNGMTEPDAMKLYEDACISAVNYACLINLRAHTTEQVVTAHMAKGMEFINRKRRAKHQPLVYSWNTIELKPDAQVKQPYKGGTHASPARHKRRAHMRRLSAGGFTWIPEMWVGSIENGLIVHDYVADRELKGQG
jgi:hypothetical protein